MPGMLGNDWRNDLAIRLLESGEEISAEDRTRIVGRLLNLIDERQAMVEVVEAAREFSAAANLGKNIGVIRMMEALEDLDAALGGGRNG